MKRPGGEPAAPRAASEAISSLEELHDEEHHPVLIDVIVEGWRPTRMLVRLTA